MSDTENTNETISCSYGLSHITSIILALFNIK